MEIKYNADMITHALTGMDDSLLYRNITVMGVKIFKKALIEFMEDGDVFGYYYQNKRSSENRNAITLKIMTNYFTALLKHTTPYVMKFWASEEGVRILMDIYPTLHKKGVKQKSLTLEHFESFFKKVDIDYLTKVLDGTFATEKIEKYMTHTVRAF